MIVLCPGTCPRIQNLKMFVRIPRKNCYRAASISPFGLGKLLLVSLVIRRLERRLGRMTPPNCDFWAAPCKENASSDVSTERPQHRGDTMKHVEVPVSEGIDSLGNSWETSQINAWSWTRFRTNGSWMEYLSEVCENARISLLPPQLLPDFPVSLCAGVAYPLTSQRGPCESKCWRFSSFAKSLPHSPYSDVRPDLVVGCG
ncbi:hypothetical protein IWX90DRAFT_51575 [Phyllosticta citrichinensis]|uniref:Uncharacterized protein n=1 Tax=Phyllosticta citrichinensis TaxID=1130410 RepID=A0ABR1XID9_9PEZI